MADWKPPESDPVVSAQPSGWKPPASDLPPEPDAKTTPPQSEGVLKWLLPQSPQTFRDQAEAHRGGVLEQIVHDPVEAFRQAKSGIEQQQRKDIEEFRADLRRPIMERAFNPSESEQIAERLAFSFGPANLDVMGRLPPLTPIEARPAAIAAREAGYVLPPQAISEKPGIVSQALAGWGGKIKTQQAASARNQEVTNALSAKALGLPPDTVLGDQVFNAVRSRAGQAYQAVAKSIPTIRADAQFSTATAGLGGANSQAAQIFPKITKNPGIKDLIDDLKAFTHGPVPTPAALEVVKELRFNANANLKAIGDPSKHALGLAQRQAADSVDKLLERNLAAAGKPDLVPQYRQARQLIARTYDVEGATNPATGDVNARGIARLSAKGRPLTGELDQIANTAAAFPKAMQMPAAFGHEENMSVLDFFFGVGSAMSGHPEGVLATMLRGPARSVALSKPLQNAAASPKGGAAPMTRDALLRAIPATTNSPDDALGHMPP